jgi:hypothetical protein
VYHMVERVKSHIPNIDADSRVVLCCDGAGQARGDLGPADGGPAFGAARQGHLPSQPPTRRGRQQVRKPSVRKHHTTSGRILDSVWGS